MVKPSVLTFEVQCRLAGLPEPQKEFRFAAPRRWRFDYAWPNLWVRDRGTEWPLLGVALEVEGGVFSFGRHAREAGMVKDMEKYNQAVLFGWRILRVTPQQVADGSALRLVEQAIRG